MQAWTQTMQQLCWRNTNIVWSFGHFFPVPKIPSLKQTNCTCKNDGWKMILFFWDSVRFPVSFRKGNLQTLQTIGSMGRTVYLPTWIVDLYCKLVGTYTVRPMDLMGNHLQPLQKLNWKLGDHFLSGQDTSVDGDMLVRAPYGFTFEEDRQGCHLGEFFQKFLSWQVWLVDIFFGSITWRIIPYLVSG